MKDNYIDKSYHTVSRAIYILSKMFDNISIPLRNSYFYDVIVEKDRKVFTVKIISTECKAPSGFYIANLRKSGGNQNGKQTHQPFESKNCNYLYIETPENCYLIPSGSISSTRALTLSGQEKYIIPS